MDNPEILDAVNTFYKLKQEYEKNLTRMKHKIIHNPTLSKSAKRERFLLLKPKCVNCKKPVGTIFSTNDRKLVAMCGANKPGSTSEPCKLNISIEKGSVINLNTAIESLKLLRDDEKDDIIKTKLNLLFNFISEETAISEFEKQKASYEDTQKQYDDYLNKYVTITELLEKKQQIDLTDIQIYEMINNIKDLLKKASEKDASSSQLIHDSVEVLVNKLIPLLKVNNDLKYNFRSISYNNNDDTFHLIEKPYTTSQIEIVVDNPTTIVSNIK